MGKSIGIIETYGAVGCYVAADTALKAASVNMISKELVSAGLVTVTLEGDVGSVYAAVEAAVEAVKRLEIAVTGHVIPRLSDEVMDMIEPKKDESKLANLNDEPIKNESKSPELNVNETVRFEDKDYFVFKKGGIDRLKVVQLRRLARELQIDSMDRGKIKFANKSELLSAIRKSKGGK